MCNGMIVRKSHRQYRATLILVLLLCISKGLASNDNCRHPFQPENGGFACHPSPCNNFVANTVIEYFCHEGYTLKGDYKYLTCASGEWEPAMEVSCRLSQDKTLEPSIGVPTLSIVASTASSVALILLLVVLFVLLQPKLKSFHHSRRDQGVSGKPSSIVVDGVPVSLPSYEEAVYGSSGAAIAPSGSRVQIVMAEGPAAGTPGLGEAVCRGRGADPCPASPREIEAQASTSRSETVLIHRPAPSSPTGPRGSPLRLSQSSDTQDTDSSDVQSLLSLASPAGSTDDIPLLKDA
ncbi:LOW QUALITY PROTEIN: sushi domain-containing protein 6-like [Pristis pectinata]|uniref:LOW QUALITY PROTEIN: sushi domain-containing protein 6-like n=1 Tax=Pristis pectinata TaxID=685728 RepID=UPI00223D0181|nr:LOW QUALITY PROTEIN: sushi domain-containing protein 6-like [Pristis pectinata]